MHQWWTARSILSVDRGIHATCFILLVYLHCVLILLWVWLYRFASHIFCWILYGTFWPRVCSVFIQLPGRFLAVWVSFHVAVSASSSSSVFFPVCYPFAMSVFYRIIVRCLCGIYVVFVFWIGVICACSSWSLCCFVASLCFQSLTVIENLVYLLFKRRVFCLWKRVPDLVE